MASIAAFAFAFVNIVAFSLMGIDKMRAVQGNRRVPERILFLGAIIGGAFGIYIGMRTFHHKTRKPAFRYVIPCLCAVQAVIICLLLRPIVTQI